MIICSKTNKRYSDDEIKKNISFFIKGMIDSEKMLSNNDIYVISSSQCLCKIVNERLSEEESLLYIDNMSKYAKEVFQTNNIQRSCLKK